MTPAKSLAKPEEALTHVRQMQREKAMRVRSKLAQMIAEGQVPVFDAGRDVRLADQDT